MSNDKELRRLLAEKTAELQKIQQAIDSAKYQKSLDALTQGITVSDKVIELIKSKKLNGEDCRILGTFIGDHISEIYGATSSEIEKRQSIRARKNEARKARGRRTPASSSAKGAKTIPATGATEPRAEQVTVDSLVQEAIASVKSTETVTAAQVAQATVAAQVAPANIAPQPGETTSRIY